MAKDVLKAKVIKEALAADQPKKLYDGSGLVLDIRSATSASWVFKFVDGKADEAGLGSFFKVSPVIDEGAIDFTLVRRLRDRCIQLVAEGQNPRKVLKAEKLAKKVAADAPRALAIGELVKANVHLIAKKAKSPKQRQAWIDSLQYERIGDIAKMLPEEVTDLQAIIMMEEVLRRRPGDGR